ncbi:alpha/beta fold hydrolase [Rhizosaccharibacter radicis]|uniref:Alpha/beta hydrolase n=1 Tax=Rhizosaccharibacter radicis TaxID=2782605 RepID=A0ABT1VWM6_9PROT|nr:alpha/beta hydrolase [Acetobacteraceae bacterium KSS12]
MAATPGAPDPLGDVSALPAQKSVSVYGRTIRFYELGEGPTIVLLHGLGSRASFDWGRVMRVLARDHHVLAPDQLGFGLSDKPLVSYGVPLWVDMLGGFLHATGTARFDLLGESLGGWIAASYTIAASDPARGLPLPAHLVLTDAAGHRSLLARGGGAFGRPLSITQSQGSLATIFHDRSLATPALARQQFEAKLEAGDGWTVQSFWQGMEAADAFVDGRLGAIRVPTLVVWGGDDRLVPLADGRDYAARIAGARLVVVPDCGHAPPVERPQAWLDAVQPFLGR